MKIKDILELAQTKTIAEIAAEDLNMDEKSARLAMKRAGCYTIVGQPGWVFDDTENPINLERSIQDFDRDIESERTRNRVLRKRFSFDLTEDVVRRLKLHAIREDQTLYEIVEKALKEYLDKTEASHDS